jgi:hypothetical protein
VFIRQRLGESQGLAVFALRIGRPARGMPEIAQVGMVDRQRPTVVRHFGVPADQGLRDRDGPHHVPPGVLDLPASLEEDGQVTADTRMEILILVEGGEILRKAFGFLGGPEQ